jgi:hypothetical protein
LKVRQGLELAGNPAQQARGYTTVLAEPTGALEAQNKAIRSQQRLGEVGVPVHQARVYGNIVADITRKSTSTPDNE